MNIIFFFPPLIGNLYTRQVQIEGETLAIQVQDTPGVQVRSSEVWDSVSGDLHGGGIVQFFSKDLMLKEERDRGSRI